MLLPRSPTPALDALATTRLLNAAFLDGSLARLPEIKDTGVDHGKLELKKDSEGKDELDLKGDEGKVLVHLLGRMD
jgi:hypothetical protein